MIYYESEYLEFKEIVTLNLKKEIIAFANSQGGEIMIGINDLGEIIGVDDPNFEMQRIGSMIRDGIHPDVTQFTSMKQELIEDKNIIKITVQSGTKKPYHLTEKGLKPSGVFIRHGVSSVPATETRIREMIRDTDGIDYDNVRCLNQELTFSQSESYFREKHMLFDDTHKRNLGFVDEEGYYTNTALLFSNQCEHSIKCATYFDNTKMKMKSRKEFCGSILWQLESALSYIDMYSDENTEIKGWTRKDTPDYPKEAVREVLLNALIHRDYSFSGSIIVNIYEDKIEFISLGGLVKNLSYEDIMCGVSQTRNEQLAKIFYRLEYVEAFGIGIPKIKQIYKDAQYQPEFKINPASFIVILPKYKKKNSKKDTKEDLVFRRIEEDGRITRKEVEELLGCSSFTANRVINNLLDAHKIRSVGAARATYYTLS